MLADPDVATSASRGRGWEVIEAEAFESVGTSPPLHAASYSGDRQSGPRRFRAQDIVPARRDLQEIYDTIHYYLEEASVRGNFGS